MDWTRISAVEFTAEGLTARMVSSDDGGREWRVTNAAGGKLGTFKTMAEVRKADLNDNWSFNSPTGSA